MSHEPTLTMCMGGIGLGGIGQGDMDGGLCVPCLEGGGGGMAGHTRDVRMTNAHGACVGCPC